MSGTRAGGLKAKQTLSKKFGSAEAVHKHYQNIGRQGGKISRGGFATETVGRDGLTGSARARIAGAKGGRSSRRSKFDTKLDKDSTATRTGGLESQTVGESINWVSPD